MESYGSMKVFISVVVALVVLTGVYLIVPSFSSEPKRVLLETNYGNIVIELYQDMPLTAGNFEKLVSEGFYDSVLFHRVVSDFVIQGGDPFTKDPTKKTLWGTGGPGYTINDEFKDHNNAKYTIAMANAGPNTGGSQFFINLKDNLFLDSNHPVFGEVIEGKDVVDEIANVQTDSYDRPVEDVKIIKASIFKAL